MNNQPKFPGSYQPLEYKDGYSGKDSSNQIDTTNEKRPDIMQYQQPRHNSYYNNNLDYPPPPPHHGPSSPNYVKFIFLYHILTHILGIP